MSSCRKIGLSSAFNEANPFLDMMPENSPHEFAIEQMPQHLNSLAAVQKLLREQEIGWTHAAHQARIYICKAGANRLIQKPERLINFPVVQRSQSFYHTETIQFPSNRVELMGFRH